MLKYVAGLAFAVLLYLSILLHEASHAISARHYGLPVNSISIHFLGGATEIGGEAKSPRAEFVIAVVGPLTSLAVGAVSVGLWYVLPDGLLRLAVQGLAVANLVVGALNLVPGLPLDGGRVLRAAVWKVGGDPLRATVVAAWGGRVVAVLAHRVAGLRAERASLPVQHRQLPDGRHHRGVPVERCQRVARAGAAPPADAGDPGPAAGTPGDRGV